MASECYDAVVIGGGPAGAAAGLLLARAGWSVLVLERKAFPRPKVCGEYLSATNLALLDALGVGAAFRAAAGPEVRRVGVFSGRHMLRGDLPSLGRAGGWGRALGRERLDTLLLAETVRAGADVRQPWAPVRLQREGDRCRGWAEAVGGTGRLEFTTPVIVAAHGSWERGRLPTQPLAPPPQPSDLFGFKAHFRNADLPRDLMPLLAFPGGYGGFVHSDDDRVTLSCCIRRDRLQRIRRASAAGEDVEAYVAETVPGVRLALAGATRDGAWLAAGPIRPGIRLRRPPGVFAVGNAAGEAHPVVAEGISMALQSAWLLADRLAPRRGKAPESLAAAAVDYARAWRRGFGPRLRASSVVAHLAMHPNAAAALVPLLKYFPAVLTWAARLAGKARRVVPLTCSPCL
jgi:flavin-dependent dehydrogenase